jgi:hypothetical protein
MMNAGTAVSGGRTLIEVKLLIALTYLEALLENVLLIPETQNVIFKRREIYFAVYRFKHGVEFAF